MDNTERMNAAEARIADMQASQMRSRGQANPERKTLSEQAHQVAAVRSNTSALVHSTIKKIQGEDTVLLPELSRRAGEPVRFHVRQLTVQELTVANLLPQRASRMVDNYIRRGVSETDAMRRRYKLDSPLQDNPNEEINRIAEEAFDGDTAEVAKAWFELESAIACAAVTEPGVVLKYDAPVNADAGEILVWNIPEGDIREISNHALRDAFSSAEKAENFREAGADDGPVEGFTGVESQAERAGDI